MKVINAPSGLKSAATAVFLTVPIAAAQSVVMARAPWWALPLRSMEIGALWACGMSAVTWFFLLRGKWLFRWFLVGAGAVWVFFSAIAAIRTHNPGMGFFTIFIGVFFGLLSSWVKHEFGRSYFDPSMRWFEGAPKSIPALHCEVVSKTGKTSMKVSRLDEEGAFLFGNENPVLGAKSELVFRFRDREIHCAGVPMLKYRRNTEGVGFRFDGNTPDQNKELGDFIETLRGEGYV
jgi:hypothetical protein